MMDTPDEGFAIQIMIKNELPITSGLRIVSMLCPHVLRNPLVIFHSVFSVSRCICRPKAAMSAVRAIK